MRCWTCTGSTCTLCAAAWLLRIALAAGASCTLTCWRAVPHLLKLKSGAGVASKGPLGFEHGLSVLSNCAARIVRVWG